MRCVACDTILTDYEATLRSEVTDEYLDMCMDCLNEIPEVTYIDRPDLQSFQCGEDDEI